MLVQTRPLPHTTSPTPPGSATVPLATPYLRPAGLPRVNGRWPACSAHPTRPAPPTSAGRAGGNADWLPHVLPVGALPLAPDAHPPLAARPPFHNERRNPARSMPPQCSCGGRWPSRHSGKLLPTLRPRHSASTTAKRGAREMVRGLTSLPWLLPLRGPPAPLPTAARHDRHSLKQ